MLENRNARDVSVTESSVRSRTNTRRSESKQSSLLDMVNDRKYQRSEKSESVATYDNPQYRNEEEEDYYDEYRSKSRSRRDTQSRSVSRSQVSESPYSDPKRLDTRTRSENYEDEVTYEDGQIKLKTTG